MEPSSGNPTSGNAVAPWRSGRARKSTVIHIDGQAVLAKNNYVLSGGKYKYGAFEADSKPRPVKKQKTKAAPKAPRVKSVFETQRSQHNESVQAAKASKHELHDSFLAKHVDVLEPFLDNRVRDKLRATAQVPYEHQKVSMQPTQIQAEMRGYQMEGLDFMVKMHRQNLGMILGDEMGLGKTLQTISFFCYLKEQEKVTGPSLVLVPLSVLQSWCDELKRWAPSLKFIRLHSPCPEEQASQRRTVLESGSEYDVIVTTYDMAKVKLLGSLFTHQHFHYVVLDEGHKIKSSDTLVSQAVRRMHCGNKIILTGTPLQNNLGELWSLLNFLYPEIFTISKPFEDAFHLVENHVDKAMLERAQHVLDLFMLRRLKVEVEKLMPKKIETKVYCPLSKSQMFWYKAILCKDLAFLERASNRIDSDQSAGVGSSNVLNNLIMQLRKCCLHPFLFDGAETDIENTSCEELVGTSGKLAVLDMLLRSLCQKGHRCVLFSQFTSMLDIIEDYCVLRGWSYCKFDGRTARARRNHLVNRFNAPDSPYFIFLMSTRSGGMGLNLQSADTCILFDSDWNPQSDLQAMARVHRIGQKKTVHVYRLIAAGTVEARIVERAEKKLLLDQMVNRQGGASTQDKASTSLGAKELLATIKFGCDAVFGDSSDNELPSLEDIEHITDRNRLESDCIGKIKGGVIKTADQFDAEKPLSETQTFGGVNLRALREEQEKSKKKDMPKTMRGIAHLWEEVSSIKGKRDRKNRIVQVDGAGSGYGSKSVPVLSSNHYDLVNGESSVFDRELKTNRKERFVVPKRKKRDPFENQDFCQVCGDGGYIVLCPRCPVSVHPECCGLKHVNEFQSCSHHRCSVCDKSAQHAGGLLFPCQVCSFCFCEDCLPDDDEIRHIGACDRFEKLNFNSTKMASYIHCSKGCEEQAIAEGWWSSDQSGNNQICPEPMDVSDCFGEQPAEVSDDSDGDPEAVNSDPTLDD